MPVLPDKFSLRGTSVPVNGRGIAAISYETPLADAGKRFGAAIAGMGEKLHQEEQKQKSANAGEGVKALSQTQTLIDTALKDAAAATDQGQAGISGADYLQQGQAKILSGLSAENRPRFEPSIQAMIESGMGRLGKQVDQQGRALRIADVTKLFPQLAAQHASLGDPTARQEIGSALFGSIDKLRESGDIDEARAQAMKLDLQRQLVRTDVLAQPVEQRIEALRPGKDGEARWIRDRLGAEDADYLHAQAVLEQRLNRYETGTQELLQRLGSSPEGEAKAMAEIAGKHADDARFKALYVGKLAALRKQERRELATSAVNAYRLALDGRASEIDPADRLRLHKAGQSEGLLEAAQYARGASPTGDLLFKERYLAMSEGERAGYGVAELAKRLSPQDFLEVVQADQGEADPKLRARMEGLVQAVRPMLRAVMLGQYATPQERERDERLFTLIHEEVAALMADEEKKNNGRALTPAEYQSAMLRATDLAVVRSAVLEKGLHGLQRLIIAPEVR